MDTEGLLGQVRYMLTLKLYPQRLMEGDDTIFHDVNILWKHWSDFISAFMFLYEDWVLSVAESHTVSVYL